MIMNRRKRHGNCYHEISSLAGINSKIGFHKVCPIIVTFPTFVKSSHNILRNYLNNSNILFEPRIKTVTS